MKYEIGMRVEGDLACFTNPLFKSERATSSMPPPSALVGLMKSIFWKPGLEYTPLWVAVLKPFQFLNVYRNEWEFNFTGELKRQQRNTMMLKDVAYEVHATLYLTQWAHPNDNPEKFYKQFTTRLKNGQFFRAPYLGCREFFANVEPLRGDEKPIDLTIDLGPMSAGINYVRDAKGRLLRTEPLWFHAFLDKGVMRYTQPHTEAA